MTNFQRNTLLIAALCIVGMLIYPPFILKCKNGVEINMGYAWLIEPPKRGYIAASVNYALLIVQWIGVLLISSILWFIGKHKVSVSSKGNNIPSILLRWMILFIAFLFAALLYGISKEFFPPSALTGAIRGILIFSFMLFVWNATKGIGSNQKKEIEDD